MRALGVAGAVALAAAAACLNTTNPGGFIYQYQIRVFACDTPACSGPDTNSVVSTASPGDTVWLRHDILLLQASDSTHEATIRPDCAQNATVAFGASVVQSLPDPATCADSTAPEEFSMGELLVRNTRWVLDSALVGGNTYAVRGRVLVQPNIEPVFGFVVQ